MKFLVVLSLLALVVNAVRYDGYKTYNIIPRDVTALSFVKNLEREYSDVFDFWKEATDIGRSVDIMVAPERQAALEDLLKLNNIDYSIGIEDVQVAIDNAPATFSGVDSSSVAGFDYNVYHTYDEISKWIDDFKEANPALVQKFHVGTTFEGRSIDGVRIGANQGGDKKAVYYEGGIHAREWISPATVLNIANKLVEDYDKDATVTEMLNTFDYYIVPVLNCDGYEYTYAFRGDRLWRKNRNTNPTKLTNCKGVDLNRNWPYKWDPANGASDSACSDTYRGVSAGSEPETSAVTTFLTNEKREWVSFIDFHAYSQLILSPWSYSKAAVLPDNSKDLVDAGKRAADALHAVNEINYEAGPSARTLYAASGCSEDWAFQTLGAKYSYVVELRPESSNPGFLLPEDEIKPTGEETYELVKSFGQTLLGEFS